MADFKVITLQAEVRGRHIWSRKLTVHDGTKVSVLRELIEDVFHAKGTLSYQEKNIHHKMGTLDELQVGNGAVLKIKNYQKMSNELLKAIPIKILPQGEWCTIEVPQKIKVSLFKFLIECKQKLLIPHQALLKDGQRWAEDANASHECTSEELQQLQVEDITRRQNTPQQYSPRASPKTDIKAFPPAECEHRLSTDTESSGSDHNLGMDVCCAIVFSVCLPACLHAACLPALPACLHACCLPACMLPACLHAACLSVCVCSFLDEIGLICRNLYTHYT